MIPGATTDGFEFESGELPAVQSWYIRGRTPIPDIEEMYELYPGLSEQEFSQALDILHNSVKGHTLGPGSVNCNEGADTIVAFLQTQMPVAAKAGWISDMDRASLLFILEAVRIAIRNHDQREAGRQLDILRHDVAARKNLSPEVSTMLRVSIECCHAPFWSL